MEQIQKNETSASENDSQGVQFHIQVGLDGNAKTSRHVIAKLSISQRLGIAIIGWYVVTQSGLSASSVQYFLEALLGLVK